MRPNNRLFVVASFFFVSGLVFDFVLLIILFYIILILTDLRIQVVPPKLSSFITPTGSNTVIGLYSKNIHSKKHKKAQLWLSESTLRLQL